MDDQCELTVEAEELDTAAAEEPEPPPLAAGPALEPPKPTAASIASMAGPPLTTEDIDRLLANNDWDPEQVRDVLITGALLQRARGKPVASFDGSTQEWLNPAIHFQTANGSRAADLWHQFIDGKRDDFYRNWKALRAAGMTHSAIRLALRFQHQLVEWAKLPVEVKFAAEATAAAQAVEAQRTAATAATIIAQYPENLPTGRLAAFRRAGLVLTLAPDGEHIMISGAKDAGQIERVRAEKPMLLQALKAEQSVLI